MAFRISVALILMLLFMPISPGGAQDTGDEVITAMVEDVMSEVERLRGLDFIYDIKSELISASELSEFLKTEIERQLPPDRERAIELVYGELGLIPKGEGFVETYEDMLQGQAGGIYDGKKRRLLIVASNLPGVSEEGDVSQGMFSFLGADPMLLLETVLVHELCHALEDQHFGFYDDFEKLHEVSSTDRELAMQCLVEGSATRLMMDNATGGVPLTPIQRGLNRILTNLLTQVTIDAPAFFKRTLIAPYTLGEGFASYLVDKGGGWAAMDDAYGDYPASMEQIIHPDKYLFERDDPSGVELADFTAVLGDGYDELIQDTLGEMLVSTLFSIYLKRDDYKGAAKGWDGDRLAGLQGPDGEVTLIWHTVWDSDGDAAEFAKALEVFLLAKMSRGAEVFGMTSFVTGDAAITMIGGDNGREFYIGTEGDQVILVDNAPEDLGMRLLDTAMDEDFITRR